MRRWLIFLGTILGLWAVLHAYVFWRVASVPWVAAHVPGWGIVAMAGALWASYPLSRLLEAWRWTLAARLLEWVGALWVGWFFLTFAAVLLTDVLSLGGLLLPRVALELPGYAALVATALALCATVQGLRPPAIRRHEVTLAGLPPAQDGVVLVAVSDLHLGSLLGARWLRGVIAQITALQPAVVVIVGDLVDGNVLHAEPLLPLLQTLRAPLGVYVVTGNHDFYAGLVPVLRLCEAAGFTVLRDRCVAVAPGLVLAGIDDLGARRQLGPGGEVADPLAIALAARPAGATVLLTHTPAWGAATTAARAGVGLLLAGHTHGGQLWPFSYLVRLSFRLHAGRYTVDGMTAIVGRGTGTWGPRMRLWHRSEILHLTLRAAPLSPGASG